jgi:hypothetical protein
MMVNKAVLIGNLGRDPALFQLIISFRIDVGFSTPHAVRCRKISQ